jgi:hypothetical protein
MSELRVLGLELGPFVGARGELVDLADLPGQAFAFALQVELLRARGIQCSAPHPSRRPTRGERLRVDRAVCVEQCAHRRGAGQALPGVLAVDVDEVVGRFAQLRNRRRAAVDPCSALALRIDGPAQQQAIGVVAAGIEAGLGQPADEARRDVEFGADLRACGALAHHADIATAAERELQGVDEDRLAGAGLSGQHGEKPVELDLELGDDHEIAERQPAQHRETTFS